MAKAQKREQVTQQDHAVKDQRVVFQVIAIASIVLGALLAIITGLLTKILTPGSTFEKGLLTAGNLFTFWLVVSSAVRAVERLRKGIPIQALLLTGISVSVLGIMIQQLIYLVAGWLNAAWALTPTLRVLKFYAAAGLVVSLIVLIRLRVRNKTYAKFLETVFILLIAALFFYFAG